MGSPGIEPIPMTAWAPGKVTVSSTRAATDPDKLPPIAMLILPTTSTIRLRREQHVDPLAGRAEKGLGGRLPLARHVS